MYSPYPLLGLRVANNSLIVVIILHVGDFVLVVQAIAYIARVVDRPNVARLEGLRAAQAAGAQPAVVVVVALALGPEVVAVADDGLLVAGVPGEVVVEPAVAGHAAGDEELLPGGQVVYALRIGVGVGPGPGGELEDEVVAGGQELFGRDLARLAKCRRVCDGRVLVT